MRPYRLYWGALAALFVLGSAGCATRGYVRDQVADLDRQIAQANGQLGASLQSTQGTATAAAAKADQASNAADAAGKMALGDVGYREAARFRIHFAFDKDAISDSARAILDQASDQIQKNPQYLIELLGFTDPIGTEAYNLGLGERRADAALRYLASKDLDEISRYQTVSYGQTPPESEESGWGQGPDRRQVAIVLVERTPGTGIAVTQNVGGSESSESMANQAMSAERPSNAPTFYGPTEPGSMRMDPK